VEQVTAGKVPAFIIIVMKRFDLDSFILGLLLGLSIGVVAFIFSLLLNH
jgi:hypothetical protein